MKLTAKQDSIIIETIISENNGISKTTVRNWIKLKFVFCNQNLVNRTDFKVKKGDIIEIRRYTSKETGKIRSPYKILFEDEYFIAVLKPPGLITSGEVKDKNQTLHKHLSNYISEKTGKKNRLYTIHRIDKEVTGIVLFAKNEEIGETMKSIWPNVEKKYKGLVEGCPAKEDGIVKSWLSEYKQKVFSSKESSAAKYAITEYKILEKFPKHTLLEFQLHTGRKNQIRVHMHDLGCPIVGDWKYGASSEIKRQIRLFAYYLSFNHPFTNKQITIQISLPVHFLKLSDQDEKYK